MIIYITLLILFLIISLSGIVFGLKIVEPGVGGHSIFYYLSGIATIITIYLSVMMISVSKKTSFMMMFLSIPFAGFVATVINSLYLQYSLLWLLVLLIIYTNINLQTRSWDTITNILLLMVLVGTFQIFIAKYQIHAFVGYIHNCLTSILLFISFYSIINKTSLSFQKKLIIYTSYTLIFSFLFSLIKNNYSIIGIITRKYVVKTGLGFGETIAVANIALILSFILFCCYIVDGKRNRKLVYLIVILCSLSILTGGRIAILRFLLFLTMYYFITVKITFSYVKKIIALVMLVTIIILSPLASLLFSRTTTIESYVRLYKDYKIVKNYPDYFWGVGDYNFEFYVRDNLEKFYELTGPEKYYAAFTMGKVGYTRFFPKLYYAILYGPFYLFLIFLVYFLLIKRLIRNIRNSVNGRVRILYKVFALILIMDWLPFVGEFLTLRINYVYSGAVGELGLFLAPVRVMLYPWGIYSIFLFAFIAYHTYHTGIIENFTKRYSLNSL